MFAKHFVCFRGQGQRAYWRAVRTVPLHRRPFRPFPDRYHTGRIELYPAAESTVAIGATTTMAEFEESPILRALAGGISLPGRPRPAGRLEIRNMATLGGNMANGSPAADLATPLLALDATVVVAERAASARCRWPITWRAGIPAAPRRCWSR